MLDGRVILATSAIHLFTKATAFLSRPYLGECVVKLTHPPYINPPDDGYVLYKYRYKYK